LEVHHATAWAIMGLQLEQANVMEEEAGPQHV
jgi:hypothetical protein